MDWLTPLPPDFELGGSLRGAGGSKIGAKFETLYHKRVTIPA